MKKEAANKVHEKWYTSNWFTILMLIFIAPVGIFLIWKYSNWSKVSKIIATIASALFFIYVVVAGINAPPTITIDDAKSGRIETENTSYRVTGSISGVIGDTTITVNDSIAQIGNGKYFAVIELKEGDNTIVVSAKKKDKVVQESIIIHRFTAAEIQARKDAEAARQKSEQEAAAKSKAEADAVAAANKAAADKKAAEDAAAAKAAADKKAAEDAINNAPAEYRSALAKATSYANTQHMSKKGVYDQLVSEYGEQFSAAAAQYGIDNVKADWNANALAKARSYQSQQSMSPAAIHDQLTSSYGEQFTQAEADYAIAHL